jgi:shikimate kinase
MTGLSPVMLPPGKRQIHLAGFMGSGKSTVGRLLARRLLWNFLDLDAVVERHAGRSIAQIFDEDGEAAFREMESHVLRQVVSKPDTVVALGGGTLIERGNVDISRSRAVLVWLRCPLEVLRERCGDVDTARPLWGDPDALQARLEERLPGYRSAELRVDAGAEPEAVVEAVLTAIERAETSDRPGDQQGGDQ